MTLEHIPAELRALNQWIIWRQETTAEGRLTKVPYNPFTGFRASVTDPSNWASWLVANQALAASGYTGLGFVFTKADPYCGLDLDATGDPGRRAFQETVYKAFMPGTYSELSPSGNGLHMIGRATVPTGKRRNSVELYSSERFFTMTGNVHAANPIANVQPQADWLWRELGGDAAITDNSWAATDVDPDQDQVIFERAKAAVNGDLFLGLWNGDWQAMGYPSQSEADFALVDILAFYTQSPTQVKRMFRLSALGQRDKARDDKARVNGRSYVDHMINRSFDRQPPPIDIETIRANLEAQFSRESITKLGYAGVQDGAVPAAPKGENPYLSAVPGLLGQIAYYVYQSSPRPVPEIALAAAIGLMAGITGRAWNVSGTGLNHYIMLLAGTGRGKEAIHTGIRKLMTQVADAMIGGCPGAVEFLGPDDIASGQALVKYLTKTSRSFVTVQGEFDLTLKSFTQRNANAALLKLKQIILKAYSRSGRGQVLEPTIYSDDAKNTHAVQSPAITIIGEGTPEKFYGLLDESLVADGLLPRFTLIHYDGIRVPLHKAHGEIEPPLSLVRAVAALCGQSLMLNQANRAIDVILSPEATRIMDEYDAEIDRTINQPGSNDTIQQIWNRAHLKSLKLAALVAVGVNMLAPVIDADAARYAIAIVNYDTKRLVAKFESGEVGESESRQISELRKLFRKFFKTDPAIAHKVNATEQQVRDKIVPYRYLQSRTANMTCFKSDRQGAGSALGRALETLTKAGVMQQLGPMDTRKYAPQGARLYSILDADWLARHETEAED